jgi:hypothetical protein
MPLLIFVSFFASADFLTEHPPQMNYSQGTRYVQVCHFPDLDHPREQVCSRPLVTGTQKQYADDVISLMMLGAVDYKKLKENYNLTEMFKQIKEDACKKLPGIKIRLNEDFEATKTQIREICAKENPNRTEEFCDSQKAKYRTKYNLTRESNAQIDRVTQRVCNAADPVGRDISAGGSKPSEASGKQRQAGPPALPGAVD